MNGLRLIAGWKGHLLALCVGLLVAWWIQSLRWDADVSRVKTGFAIEIEAQAKAALSAVQAARDEERRRIDEAENAARAARESTRLARIDADNRAASEQRLRQRIDTLLANAIRRDPALADGGSPGRAGIDLLADVLGRSIERSGRLAAIADRSRIAGLTCERLYDAVRTTH